MITTRSLWLVMSLAGPTALQAQEQAAFVSTLGNDTIQVERSSQTRTTLEGDILRRQGTTTLTHYRASFARDGQLVRYEASTRFPADPSRPAQTSVTEVRGDSLFGSLQRGDSSWTVEASGGAAARPLLYLGMGLYQWSFRELMRAGTDSVTIPFYLPGARRTSPTAVWRRGRDTVVVDFFSYPWVFLVDRTGRIQRFDGSASTVKVLTVRHRTVDFDRLVRHFADLERSGHGLGALSPRDTTRGTVAGAHLEVDYSRPQARGRVILGGLVPWDTVWRTGADAATQFTTDRDLMIGGTKIPAGRYTLYSLPTRSGATLIVNSQTGQWGTVYDEAKDFARVPLATRTLGSPVETFTISLEPAGTGGVMALSWDRTRWEVPIEAAP